MAHGSPFPAPAKTFIFQFVNTFSSFLYLAFVAPGSTILGVTKQCWNDDCMDALALQV